MSAINSLDGPQILERREKNTLESVDMCIYQLAHTGWEHT